MLIEVRVPELGHDAKEAIIVTWHKEPGDAVAADEALLDVMTDKVNVEVPSPAAGVLKEQRAARDDTVAVGAVIALLESTP
jgi:2-oxoglutarate dehydrogenase E2 component (dihydrolipoamide succinyltransferase)